MRRRTLLPAAAAAVLHAMRKAAAKTPVAAPRGVTLANVPIRLDGTWPGSLPQSALTVVSRMRQVCLEGVRLLSDRQPDWLLVDDHTSGPPHIWLHFDGRPFAWMVVDIGPRDWSKLAYQFGHEFGHVVCNLWERRGPRPAPPDSSAWLEEALAEAFSIRGLALLANSWARDPPFPRDAAFAGAIREYRANLLGQYQRAAMAQGATVSLTAWFQANRGALEADAAITAEARVVVPAIVAAMEADPGCVEALGALYRWPRLGALPMQEYLRRWQQSCTELGASPVLPIWLRKVLLG